MKVWMIILRASADEKAEGGEDEVFTCVYKKLERAKAQCVTAMKDDDVEETTIEWADVTEKGKSRKWYGRPTADVDFYFDILEVEVV